MEPGHCIAPTPQSPTNLSATQRTPRRRIRPCASLKINVPEDFPPEPGTAFNHGDMGNCRESELTTLNSQGPRGRNPNRVRYSKVHVFFLFLHFCILLFSQKKNYSNLISMFVVVKVLRDSDSRQKCPSTNKCYVEFIAYRTSFGCMCCEMESCLIS